MNANRDINELKRLHAELKKEIEDKVSIRTLVKLNKLEDLFMMVCEMIENT